MAGVSRMPQRMLGWDDCLVWHQWVQLWEDGRSSFIRSNSLQWLWQSHPAESRSLCNNWRKLPMSALSIEGVSHWNNSSCSLMSYHVDSVCCNRSYQPLLRRTWCKMHSCILFGFIVFIQLGNHIPEIFLCDLSWMLRYLACISSWCPFTFALCAHCSLENFGCMSARV